MTLDRRTAVQARLLPDVDDVAASRSGVCSFDCLAQYRSMSGLNAYEFLLGRLK
jgi:hypothetical protein